MAELTRGLVQVYTGEGKGKTTAALGLALRAAGHGMRVVFIQFAKSPNGNGERGAAERLAPEVKLQVFAAPEWGDADKAPTGTPWWLLPPSEEDREKAQEGLEFARRVLAEGRCDVVVLDEIFAALKYELISLEQLMALIRERPPQVELVLTGRGAPPEVIEVADLVTEMRAVKHPFEQGVPARRGIEY
jgi:cob(I)alamin adenosyltransferase